MRKSKKGKTLKSRSPESIRGRAPVAVIDHAHRLSATEMAHLRDFFAEQTCASVQIASTPSGTVNVFSDVLGGWS